MNFPKRQSCLRQRKKRYTRACRPFAAGPSRLPESDPGQTQLLRQGLPPGRSLPAKTAPAADTPQQQPPSTWQEADSTTTRSRAWPLWGYKPGPAPSGRWCNRHNVRSRRCRQRPATGNLCRAIGVQGPDCHNLFHSLFSRFRLRRLRGVRREHHGHIVFIAIRPNPVCTVDGEGQGQRISPGFCPGKVYRGGHVLCRQSLQLRGWPRKVTSSIWVKISARMPSGT